MRRKELFRKYMLSFAALCGLALTIGSCASEETAQNAGDNNDKDNDKNLTAFVAGAPESRTTMDYATGAFYWEAGDYIYVKDDNGTWRRSSNAPTTKTASYKFYVPGKFIAKDSYRVYYPGKGRARNEVRIRTDQEQETPRTTDHFGISGDCASAMATKAPGEARFTFTLDHQAAILVFQPYLGNNNKLVSTYVTKIEVSSDNNIAGSYTLDPTTGELTGTGTDTQITLKTIGSGDYANGFPLTKNISDLSENGAYMLIKPGTHVLTVKYTLRDVESNVEGTITQTLSSHEYKKNTYYNMKANLLMTDYDGDHYYMWDAKKQFWDGYEWTKNLPGTQGQPTLRGGSSSNKPAGNTDPRWYNETYLGNGNRYDAQTTLFRSLPNANEMSWYVMHGDPRWDKDRLWTTMRHLYKGGMWVKKKSVLQAEHHYNTEMSADGVVDLRYEHKVYLNSTLKPGLPSASEASKYFYLPALGYYDNSGYLSSIGSSGFYWSSSSNTLVQGIAHPLTFGSSGMRVGSHLAYRSNGMRVQTFE
mgnify:CR=1 FL=1